MDLNVSKHKQRETAEFLRNTALYVKSITNPVVSFLVGFLSEGKKIIWGTTVSISLTLLLLDHTRNYINKETERSELF